MPKQPNQKRTTPTQGELAELAESHLYYEIAMLISGVTEEYRRTHEHRGIMKLDRAHPARAQRTAFFESTLLHARVLDDFLTQPPGRYPDDVWAGDYFTNSNDWTPPKDGPLARTPSVFPGEEVKVSINKQLAHFSLRRLQQTPFYLPEIANAVLADMNKFARNERNCCYTELEGVRNLIAGVAVRGVQSGDS